MNFITLERAVTEIRQGCNASRSRKPFFFIVGAGISFPAIPVAAELVTLLKEKAARYSLTESPPKNDPLNEYAFWFRTAYPHARDRQVYLRELIQGKPSTPANLRLAHLLLDQKVTNLVVTPNFDDLLTRALNLFGGRPVVCDHPRTVERIDPDGLDVQLVHVHGTYWFYDCCNLAGEIEQRAEPSNSDRTMGSFLEQVLSGRSPLVVGYSGWERDVIMQALKKHLRTTRKLRYRLYWFCHTRAEAERLPDWLNQRGQSDDDDVCFVVPEESKQQESRSDGSRELAPPMAVQEAAAGEPRLEARVVFEHIIKEFGIEEPDLTRDPLGFFASQLEASRPRLSPEETNIYLLESAIEKVRKARIQSLKAEEVDRESGPGGKSEDSILESIRGAIRSSRYQEAVQEAQALQERLERLSDSQLKELFEVAWSSAKGLSDGSPQMLQACDLVVDTGDKLTSKPDMDLSVQHRVAWALLNKGVALGKLNRSEEAIAAYDDAINRFADAPEPSLRETVAKALVNKGVTLHQLNRSNDAIAAYDDAINRFADAPELALREQVAWALLNKGLALGKLNRGEEAIAAYDDAINRFTDALELTLREQVAKALVYKGVALGQLNRSDDAIAAYDDAINRFGDALEPSLREQVAKALAYKGIALGQLNRSDEAITAYDDAINRFADAPELALRELVATELVNKGATLGQLNRSDDAIAAYDDAISRFGDALEPSLREQVAWALLNKGVTLHHLNRYEDEIAAYDDAINRFADAPELALRALVARALVYKGVVLGQLNRSGDAIATYDDAISRFANAPELALREQVALALVNKGVTLGQLDRSDDAIAAYDDAINRFADAPEPSLRESVAAALNSAGFLHLCFYKRLRAAGDSIGAQTELSHAETTLNGALERTPNDAVALGNLGYVAFLRDDIDEARRLLTRAIKLGGEKLRMGELADAALHPLPEDEAFRELVLSIPGAHS